MGRHYLRGPTRSGIREGMSETGVYSYDPRVWAQQWSPQRSLEARASQAGMLRRKLVGAGAASAIVLAGGLAAWLSRPAYVAAPVAAGQVAADAPPPAQSVRRTLQLGSAAELAGALQRMGLDAATAQKVAAEAAPALAGGDVRAVLEMTRGPGGALAFYRLEASNADSSGAVVRLGEGGAFETSRVAAQVTEKITVLHGIMDGDSFYTSAVAVGVPNTLISPFAKALSFDIDFQRDVAAGDAFELAYAQPVNAAGEPQGAPRLVYASMTTQTVTAAVYLFRDSAGQEGWFDASGRTVARTFMRTPIDGARISSKFGMRFHPTLHYNRLHKGVDFAAPVGTSIYAASPGTIRTASPNPCGGNWVIIDHDKGMETRYFHLSRYAEGLHAGQKVQQGETIGYVGSTGSCTTGPHLHYEVHMEGQPVDPLSILPAVDSAQRRSLEGRDLEAFEKVRDRVDVSRAQGSS